MPEGTFRGPKNDYIYVMDGGGRLKIKLYPANVATGSGLVAFDPQNPGTLATKPDGFKPRGVWWEGTESGFAGRRKFLVCGTNAAALYTATTSTNLEIDGADGKTTGRKGEQLSFI